MTITTTTTNATALPEGVRWAMPVEELEAENAAQEASLKSKYEAEANAACEAGPEACKALLSDVGYALEFHLEPGLVRRVREMAHAPVTVFSDAPEYRLVVERFGCHAVTWSQDDLSGCTIEGEVAAEARRFLQSKAAKLVRKAAKLVRKRAVKYARRKAVAEARREKAREEAAALEEAKAAVVAAALESAASSTACTGGDDSTSAASVEGHTTAAPVSVSVSGFSSASLSGSSSPSGGSTGSTVAEGELEGAAEGSTLEGAVEGSKLEGAVEGSELGGEAELEGALEGGKPEPIFVRTLAGRTAQLQVAADESVLEVLARYAASTGEAASRFVWRGRSLSPNDLVPSGVVRYETLHALVSVRGGGDAAEGGSFKPYAPGQAEAIVEVEIGGQLRERVPEPIQRSYYGTHKLEYGERLTLGSFFVGNFGKDIAWAVLRHRVGNQSELRRWLLELASGRRDHVDYYYDVRRSEWLYQGGHANLSRRPPSEAVRLYTAWEAECQRVWRREGRYPTLEEQCAFFGVPHQPGAAGSSGASNGEASGSDAEFEDALLRVPIHRRVRRPPRCRPRPPAPPAARARLRR